MYIKTMKIDYDTVPSYPPKPYQTISPLLLPSPDLPFMPHPPRSYTKYFIFMYTVSS